MELLFDSRDARCKSPFGAAAAGVPVSLSVYPDRGLGITDVFLSYNCEMTGRKGELPLAWSGLGLSRDRYDGALDTSGMLGPVWYRFRLSRTDGKSLYLGPAAGKTGGAGVLSAKPGADFQLTVFDASYRVPGWFGENVTYHIFVDRFAREGEIVSEGRRVHENWFDTPDFPEDEGKPVLNDDFYGGNLKGIRSKLPYLKSLGVGTLYLSPVFKAASNHRYDTGDYLEIDPMVGTNEEFTEFCACASEYGIRVLLDGVFNHTGFDSRYFNGRGTYDGTGAYQSKDSKYFPWYSFGKWPEKYSCWWGVWSLPQVNESNPAYMRFIFKDKDSVVRRWLRAGASGFRLDVADELPDAFIAGLRRAARREKPDAAIIGEVWEDASNKISYGRRRRYLLGEELDGVMNYPFRKAVLEYLCGGGAEAFKDAMESLRENYPEMAFKSLMNLIGTHDTPRILTLLGLCGAKMPETRKERAAYSLSAAQRGRALKLLRLGAAVQFTFPGSPCVFYGDEAGLEGFGDPFNRRGYPWGREDKPLLAYYRLLGRVRAENPAAREGGISYLFAQGPALAYERVHKKERLLLAVNRGGAEARIRPGARWNGAYEYIAGKPLIMTDGELALPPESALIAAIR